MGKAPPDIWVQPIREITDKFLGNTKLEKGAYKLLHYALKRPRTYTQMLNRIRKVTKDEGWNEKDRKEIVTFLSNASEDIKMYKDYPKIVLDAARAANADRPAPFAPSQLRKHIETAEPWKSGLGARSEFYYMSSMEQHDVLDDYLQRLSANALHEPRGPDRDIAGTYPYEARVRKSRKTPIKKGSVIGNVLHHLQRLEKGNAAHDLLKEKYARLSRMNLTSDDKRVIRQMDDNLLMKYMPVDAPFKLAAKFRRAFWRPTMSVAVRPATVLWRVLRNLGQNVAYSITAVNWPEAAKQVVRFGYNRAKGKTLRDMDPEMMRRFDTDFDSYVSQHRAYYKQFLMQYSSDIAKDFSANKTLVRKITAWMERWGMMYGLSDKLNRITLWPTQYQIIKHAATDYSSGKINLKQFYKRTKLDGLRETRRQIIQDDLSRGMIDDVANNGANWTVRDIHFPYKTGQRPGVSQTMAERTLMSVYNFPANTVELYYHRGLKPILQGIEQARTATSSAGRRAGYDHAWKGAKILMKGSISSAAVRALIYYMYGRRAYGVLTGTEWQMLDPGTGTVHGLLEYTHLQMYRYENKEQGVFATIDNIAEAWSKVGETFFVPFSVEIENMYEANNDKGGLAIYRLIRNGVARKLGIPEKELYTVTRSHKQAVQHALLGSVEYLPKPSGFKAKPAKAKKKKKG